MTTESKTSRPVALDVKGLSVDFAVDGYWTPAAIDLSYQIREGEVMAMVGESGSGKSVSSMSMLGLLPKTARVKGSVKLRGQELIGLRQDQLRSVRGKQVAVIFQEPMTALNPVFPIGKQIVETIRLHTALTPSEAKKRALEMLELVELPDPAKAFNSYPHQLSGGQRQRAMIAQSISCDPGVLIADEPTTALDVTVQAEILDLIRKLKDELNSSVLLITHDMGVVADMADTINVMRLGRIVESGTVDDIFRRPEHPYTQKLLAAVPHLGQGTGLTDSVDIVLPGTTETSAIRIQQRETAEEWEARNYGDREKVLEFDNTVIEYPGRGKVKAFRAIDGVSLSVYKGEVMGLVGESGSGKSTLGRAAMALQPITSGGLKVAGIDLAKHSRSVMKDVHREAGIVFQDPASSLNPRLPIGDSIGEPLLLRRGMKGQKLNAEVERLLDAVELPKSYRNRYPHELSGGQKQRIGIARALALNPKLLVADEPTSALDVSVQATVLDLLREIQSEYGFACLFITHDLAVIDQLADRIAVLHKGKLAEVGTRDEILRAPKDPYTQRLIAAVPLPDPDAQRERREERRSLLAAGADE